MRYTTLLARAVFALALPFILAHCAGLQPNRSPLAYDAKPVGVNSGAALELWLRRTGPSANLVMHGCGGINTNHADGPGRLTMGLRGGHSRQFRSA